MSKLNLSSIASSAVGGGGLTRDLNKIKLDTLIANYPDGVSINGLDMIEFEGSRFPSFTFVEDPTSCFAGGVALMQMADALLNAVGDIVELNEELQRKPLRIKLEKIQTKSRRTYTRVKVLDTAPELPAESPTEKVNPDTGEVAPF